ncbi:TetR/AcrR family transcriptional regulator [Blastococcus sp. KM273128]|uniref:TetR/AcrR family transcriptional regulator n=1 Tax=Blastococcus sp. KM273128 TaxID=2570314 RepID=UPI001F32E451|nr:TetR/AcrR family transcriptional regulator [Blastococcus sp. KM273128]MCF6744266.1 TetR/AcrR family transcriptional regulator [Blastococcus sp. KM273128]
MTERRTQEQRRADTRSRLLAATIQCLVEHGYAGTTTQRVQERAGLSRGALLHHFATKEALLVAAVSHVADSQIGQVRADAGAGRVRDEVDLLHRVMSGPLFLAGLELWSAARTEPALRAALLPAERRVGAAVRELVGELFPGAPRDRAEIDGLLALYRGLALTSVLRGDGDLDRRVLQLWVDRVLATPAARVGGGAGPASL